MKCILGILCLLAWRTATAAPATDTEYISTDDFAKCSTEDEHVGDCIKDIINGLIPRLQNGNPKLKIPPYEPFLLNRTSFRYESGAVKGRISVRNVKIYGFALYRAKEVSLKIKGDKIKLRLVGEMPKMNILGNYKADMQVNQLQLKPKGDFNVTLFDVEITTGTEGEIYRKDGKRFVRLDDIDSTPKIGDLTIKANGIFPDPELDQIALNVANQYWRDIYGIILPETRQYWQPLILRMLNESLQQIPIDQFLKE
ncbi:circadian clock-controlled protein daywake [Drosophila tropicalis]|uniref:circadian clock-controlled protein daywake n=1 Tax=Drosophila tropicalis TaxID=46794 RepID=UPI0035AB6E1D